jgi:dolichol kinase
VLGALSVAALAIELVRRRHSPARELFLRVTGSLLRLHEHERLSGATWLALSLLGAVVLLPPGVAVAAMWCVTAGDASAALIGRAFGARLEGGSGKTVTGSAACLVVSWAGILAIAHLPLAESIVGATAAAMAERPTHPVDDNVRIVIASAGAILLWRIVFS